MISIIIPAHNEESVIERCLKGLIAGVCNSDAEIIVVCNGCNDGTAKIAREVGGPVQVLETDIASKSHALNLGDGAAHGFPRLYIDADVVVSPNAVRRVADVLREGKVLAAAPRMRVALEGSSWAVRAYYRMWMRLPYHESGMIGSGFYGMSELGRSRFEAFPDITSDDGFVRVQFAPHERTTVEDCTFEVIPPRSLGGVLRIKTRSQVGARELRAAFPELLVNDPRYYRRVFARFLVQPSLWPSVAVYCFVLYTTRARGMWRRLVKKRLVWDRDDSSRVVDSKSADARDSAC